MWIYVTCIYIKIYPRRASSCQCSIKCSPVWGGRARGLDSPEKEQVPFVLEQTTRETGGRSPLVHGPVLSFLLGGVLVVYSCAFWALRHPILKILSSRDWIVLGKVTSTHLSFFHLTLLPAQAFGQGAAGPRGLSLQSEGKGILWNSLHRWDVSATTGPPNLQGEWDPDIVLSQLSTVQSAVGHLGPVLRGQCKFIIWISKTLWSCLEQPKDIIRVMLI